MRRCLPGLVFLTAVMLVGGGAAAAAPAGDTGDFGSRSGGGGGGETLSYRETIELSALDVEEFWEQSFPEFYGAEYTEIGEFAPYDSGRNDEFGECAPEDATYDDVADNAFYCVLDDAIRYDDETLFPRLFESFGPFSLAMVIAHEWGHAIQGRYFPTLEEFAAAPSIQKELQADCFAGAWVQYVDEEESRNLRLDPGDIETGLAGMLDFADPPGTDFTEQGAHGNGFDRVNAFSEGFEQGAGRCVEYQDLALLPLVTEIPFTNPEDLEQEGNLPFDEAIRLGVRDLDQYWDAVFTASDLEYDAPADVVDYDPRRRRSLPECDDLGLDPRRPKKYRGLAFWCAEDDTIYYDEEFLEDVHADIGDFGAMGLVGGAWAAAMQDRLEISGDRPDVALQADCFGGAWAGSIPLDLDGDGGPDVSARGGDVVREAEILLSPGDLDEVVSAFLAFSAPATEEGDELTAFERLGAFRIGFFSQTAETDCAAFTD